MSIPLEGLPTTLIVPKKASGSSVERFSLLLLEFGEIYFDDFSVIYYPNCPTEAESIERKQRGRLKVCSYSIIFDPLDSADPVLKIAYRDVLKIERWKQQSSKIGDNAFLITATQVTEMLAGNVIGPHKFIRRECKCVFSLNYGSIDRTLSHILSLQRATKLPKADQNNIIESIVHGRRSEVVFNTSWLEDLYEEQQLELTGQRVTPLVCNPGRIMLTSSRLYFQPYNNVEVDPVLKIRLSDLRYVMKRRYMLRHVGIELFCPNGQNMFLVLETTSERNALYDKILQQPSVHLETIRLDDLLHQWQTREISNYTYLMLLNFLSDRSFNDIMQYPVMPWVLVDYTSDCLDLTQPSTFRDLSKPIGALNKERLMFFKERFNDMTGKKFLYGTHYSVPGYVLYYLVRAAPEYLLCLQNGRFDQPNRLFHSIVRTWKNVIIDHADVKELIPEFYQPPGAFLLNYKNLDLGVRTDGVRVSDVELPPWSKDAREFTEKCLEALECQYVSDHIHKWIDLIFGYKQQGEEAIKADNVFHYLTYEGGINWDTIEPNDVAALELQIQEFGQTPRQLFTRPHPRRLSVAVDLVPGSPLNRSISEQEGDKMDDKKYDPDDWVEIASPDVTTPQTTPRSCPKLHLHHTFSKIHRELISSVKLSMDGETIFSASHDKTMKMHSLNKELLRSCNISSLPLSSLAVLPDSKVVLVGSWDNTVYSYSIDYGSATRCGFSHDSSVTAICWKSNVLVTGSWDSTVKVWKFPYDGSNHKPPSPELLFELDHDTEVRCVDVDISVTRVATGVVDGIITIWNLSENCKEFEIQAHNEAVHSILFDSAGSQICTCGADGVVKIFDIHNKSEVISKRTEDIFLCMLWTRDHLVFGSQSGHIYIWDSLTLREQRKAKGHEGAVMCVDISQDGSTLVSGGKDRCLCVWKLS